MEAWKKGWKVGRRGVKKDKGKHVRTTESKLAAIMERWKEGWKQGRTWDKRWEEE